MQEATEANLKLGEDLTDDANTFLEEARSAFDNLRDQSDQVDSTINQFQDKINSGNEATRQNYDRLNEAQRHAYDLEQQAQGFSNILEGAKDSDGMRTLDAANAYEKIATAVNEANEAAELANNAATDAQAMVSYSKKPWATFDIHCVNPLIRFT